MWTICADKILMGTSYTTVVRGVLAGLKITHRYKNYNIVYSGLLY
jgi:hypothetical protein